MNETKTNPSATSANPPASPKPETVKTPQPAAKSAPAKPEKSSRKSKKAQKKAQKSQKVAHPENPTAEKPEHKTAKMVLYAIILLIFFGLVCAVTIIILLAMREPEESAKKDPVEFPDPIYSTLTGEEISDASLNNSPTFCVQIPNGKDGARPQAGLNQAAVVFEAIAEAGITRFAAVFQNTNLSAIGPIRSLRPYYLDWDLPFDCTVVHSGGSDEAIAKLRQTGARELDESNVYMWRETGSNRMWNNLFTSSADLLRYNTDRGWTTSSVKPFARYTPDENDQVIAENLTCEDAADGDEICELSPVTNIRINFSGVPSYNTVYQYDAENNRYLRSYANGEEHLSYTCPDNLYQPRTTTDCGEPTQVSPQVIIAMFVNESKMSDGYHENITTIGSGSATVFQNGEVIEGTWQKTSAKDQIVFRDNSGNLIKFAPGQVWIAAVPIYSGSISWD